MDSSQKISRSQTVIAVLVVIVAPWIGGCGDFFATSPTHLQSEKILSDLSAIRITPDPNIPLPQIYTAPPRITQQMVGGAPEWKLFYFCRNHLSDEMKTWVFEQFATKVFNKKGQSTTLRDYTVTSIAATNQLIVRCPLKEDVDAVLEFLQEVDVPPVQVKIDCLISEVYADKTLDWETTVQIVDLLGEDIAAGGSARLFGQDVLELIQETLPLPAFPGASLREVARAKMGLKIGYISDNFLAVVDLLESKGYLKVLMNPSLEVVNGKKARIESSEKVPLEKIFLRDREGFVESKTEYVDVIDSLEITPHVFADGYIGLETTALIGSKNIPEGVKQMRIVSKREIYNQQNRIRHGESLVIGGIRKSEEHSVVRGVPILKDIPILGVLFSSKDYEERATETIFIITPTISTGGIPRKEMLEEVKRKHEAPSDELLDPLGINAREKEQERRVTEAEEARIKAEAEKAKARSAAREADEKAKKAKAETEKVKEKAVAAEKQAQTETEKAKAELEKANAEVEKAKADAQKAKAEAEKAKADVQKAIAEAEKAKADAQKAVAEAEKAKADAQKATADAAKTKAEAERLATEAKKATADAEKVKAEAKAKADAEKVKAEAEAKAKAEAAAKAKREAEAKAEAKAKAEVEAKAKRKAEAKAKRKAEAKAKRKAEAKAEAEAEAKAKAEAEAKAKAEAEARAKREAETEAKAAAKAEVEDKKPYSRVKPG